MHLQLVSRKQEGAFRRFLRTWLDRALYELCEGAFGNKGGWA